jgi:transposase InsO family protein
MKGKQKATVLLHPASCHCFGDRALQFCAWRVDQNVIFVVVEGVKRKRVAEKLSLRRKRGRKRSGVRQPLPEPIAANQVWSVDFMTDALSSGRRLRTLNIVDDYTRECLAIEVDTSLGGQRVVRVLEGLKQRRGLPRQIRSDNGPEFVSRDPTRTTDGEWLRRELQRALPR